MAVLANLAYKNDCDPDWQDRIRGMGLDQAPIECEKRKFDPPFEKIPIDTQATIVHDENIVVVAFRGTEPKKPGDIVADLRFKLIPGADRYGVGEVHEGFDAALDVAWKDLVAKLRKLRNNGQSLWFTGHSLGGALATLAVMRLATEDHQATIQGLYTFGQPRVGGVEFASAFDAQFKDRSFRYVNNQDIVPRVPFRSMRYRHIGQVKYFDRRGRLFEDPGFWFRLLDRVDIGKDNATKNFTATAAATKNMKKILSESVKDHGMDNYEELLRVATGMSAPKRK